MLRPRVTHSAAHRNIRQKRPWMEYSGTTSWGSEGEKSAAWCQARPKLQWHRGLVMLRSANPPWSQNKRPLACYSHPPRWQSRPDRLKEEEGLAVGYRE